MAVTGYEMDQVMVSLLVSQDLTLRKMFLYQSTGPTIITMLDG